MGRRRFGKTLEELANQGCTLVEAAAAIQADRRWASTDIRTIEHYASTHGIQFKKGLESSDEEEGPEPLTEDFNLGKSARNDTVGKGRGASWPPPPPIPRPSPDWSDSEGRDIARFFEDHRAEHEWVDFWDMVSWFRAEANTVPSLKQKLALLRSDLQDSRRQNEELQRVVDLKERDYMADRVTAHLIEVDKRVGGRIKALETDVKASRQAERMARAQASSVRQELDAAKAGIATLRGNVLRLAEEREALIHEKANLAQALDLAMREHVTGGAPPSMEAAEAIMDLASSWMLEAERRQVEEDMTRILSLSGEL